MRSIVLTSCLIAMLAPGTAGAADFGKLVYGEKTFALSQALACVPRYDTSGLGKPALVVLLSTKPMDAAAIHAGADCDGHAFAQVVERGDGALVSVGFNERLELARVSAYGVGFTLGGDPCQGCKASAAYAGNRLRGSLATTQPLTIASDAIRIDAKFDLPKPEAPAAGVALPSGGGDPGKALQAYLKAFRDGDYETLRKVMPVGKAEDKWGYHEVEAERRERIQSDAGLEPKGAKVLEGKLLGNFALLVIEVPKLWGSGNQKAVAGLSLVDGSWRVDDISRDQIGTMFGK